MKPRNKLLYRSRISEHKYRTIVRYFALDLTAQQTSEITEINRNTINRYFKKIRACIAEHQEEVGRFEGEVELDESYFGVNEKGKINEEEIRLTKDRFLVLKNEMEKYIPRSLKTLQKLKLSQLSNV